MILRKFFDALRGVEIDDDFYDELEEHLIMADCGVQISEELIEAVKEAVKKKHLKTCDECKTELINIIKERMSLPANAFEAEDSKSIYMLIGVNGVGKTTTCGKLACKFRNAGKKVLMAAADTFRAAAIEQLEEWAKRADCELISSTEGADPGAVVFDACSATKARNSDIMICDTAGRLHNKKNLMAELGKLYKIIDRECPDYNRETLVVLDANTGQNAILQAKEFNEVADISGIVLTKMDGTAKGGVAVAIQAELGIPVKYIGYGEKIEDLKKFDVDEYVNTIFS